MKSYVPLAGEVKKKWHVVDASGQTLGRLATRVARLLTGKDKVIYTPFLDTGDHVIVVNAAKVRLTGKKLTGKLGRAMRKKLRVYRGPQHPHQAQQPDVFVL